MIDTYGKDDINTQAIRELTTEVDRVKQKLAKDEQKHATDITEIKNFLDTLPLIDRNNVTLANAVSIASGETYQFNITAKTHTGYRLTGVILQTMQNSVGGFFTNYITPFQFVNPPTNGVGIMIKNLDTDTIEVKTLVFLTTFEKIPTA